MTAAAFWVYSALLHSFDLVDVTVTVTVAAEESLCGRQNDIVLNDN